MDAIRNMRGPESVDFFSTSGRAANIDASHRTVFAQDHGTSGERIIIGRVSHADARNVGKSFRSCMVASRARCPRIARFCHQTHSVDAGFLYTSGASNPQHLP